MKDTKLWRWINETLWWSASLQKNSSAAFALLRRRGRTGENPLVWLMHLLSVDRLTHQLWTRYAHRRTHTKCLITVIRCTFVLMENEIYCLSSSFCGLDIYWYSSPMFKGPNTRSHTHLSHQDWHGGCCSWVFDPPAATTAGWLTFCLIIYKWPISRCVPAAASGLLLALLWHVATAARALFGYCDIYTPDIWPMISVRETQINERVSVHFRVTRMVDDRCNGLHRSQTCDINSSVYSGEKVSMIFKIGFPFHYKKTP